MTDPRLKFSGYRAFQGKDTTPLTLTSDSSLVTKDRSTSSSGLAPFAGAWTETEATHLLKRCSFGVRRNEIDTILQLGMDEAVNLLTTPEPNQTLPINNYNEYEEDPHVAPGETWVGAPHGEAAEFLRVYSLKQWILDSYLQSGVSLHEKMVLFWHNLIPTQFFLIEFANLSYAYYKILDNNAFGNFREMIKQITTDPSMLLYLNGAYNVKEAPDENYARELQELFTVGKGPDSKYTEEDVYQAARVLTGWSIDAEAAIQRGEAVPIFISQNHDEGDKQFSSFYGNRVISGKSGEAGAEETDELIDMILETNEAAKYICRRLYNFFIYHKVDDSVEVNIIEPLAQVFRNNDYEILPVIRTLLKSEHFYDSVNLGAYVKNPLDHTIGIFRGFDVQLPELVDNFDFLNQLYFFMHDAGMGIGDPPSVSGWQAYYQQPSFDKIWINSDTIIKRVQVQDYLVYDVLDLPRFVDSLANPSDPNDLIAECNHMLQGIALDDTVISDLKSNLLAGQQTDNYWTNAWNLYKNNPEDEEYRSTIENRLKSLFRQFLQLAEFQLM